MDIARKKIMAYFIERMTGDNLPVSAYEVAIRLKIPVKTTDTVLANLVSEGYIGCNSGKPKGYAMVRSPDEMNQLWELERKRKEPKRVITPYKGGRTAQIPMRFTPEEKAALQTAAASAGMSMSDFVMMLLQLYEERSK